MKKTTLILLLIVFVTAGFAPRGCKKGVGSGGGDAGREWDLVRNVTTHINIPYERPPQYLTPKGVKVYSTSRPSPSTLATVDEAITNQLRRSSRDNPNFSPPDAWREWKSFDEHKEYAVLLYEPNYRSTLPETLDCPLIQVRSGDVFSVAGTVAGVYLVNYSPAAPGGLYLVVPRPDREDAPNAEACRILFREGVDNESEHARLMDAPGLYLYYRGANDVHKIFPEITSSKSVEVPSVSVPLINLTEKEVEKLVEDYGK